MSIGAQDYGKYDLYYLIYHRGDNSRKIELQRHPYPTVPYEIRRFLGQARFRCPL